MRGPGSISTGVTFFSKFYNPNLHNIASLRFKMKNPNAKIQCRAEPSLGQTYPLKQYVVYPPLKGIKLHEKNSSNTS